MYFNYGREEILRVKRARLEKVDQDIAGLNSIRQNIPGVQAHEIRKKEEKYNKAVDAYRQAVRTLETTKRRMEEELSRKKSHLYTIEREEEQVQDELTSLDYARARGISLIIFKVMVGLCNFFPLPELGGSQKALDFDYRIRQAQRLIKEKKERIKHQRRLIERDERDMNTYVNNTMDSNIVLKTEVARCEGDVQKLQSLHADSNRDAQRRLDILHREANDLRRDITRLER